MHIPEDCSDEISVKQQAAASDMSEASPGNAKLGEMPNILLDAFFIELLSPSLKSTSP
jgi:hypothetical protein